MNPKECRIYKVLKTILQSKHDRENNVRFRNSNRAGTSIKVEFFVDSTLAKANEVLVRVEERIAFCVYAATYDIFGTL